MHSVSWCLQALVNMQGMFVITVLESALGTRRVVWHHDLCEIFLKEDGGGEEVCY